MGTSSKKHLGRMSIMKIAIIFCAVAQSVAVMVNPEVILGTQEEINKEYADRVKTADTALKTAKDSFAKEKQDIQDALLKRKDEIKKDSEKQASDEKKKADDLVTSVKTEQDNVAKTKTQIDKDIQKVNQDSQSEQAAISKKEAKIEHDIDERIANAEQEASKAKVDAQKKAESKHKDLKTKMEQEKIVNDAMAKLKAPVVAEKKPEPEKPKQQDPVFKPLKLTDDSQADNKNSMAPPAAPYSSSWGPSKK